MDVLQFKGIVHKGEDVEKASWQKQEASWPHRIHTQETTRGTTEWVGP